MGAVHVLVCGWPGSGRSTLAPPLAAELGWPLLAKDVLKEALLDVLGPPDDVAAGRRLGAAAATAMLAAARTVDPSVLESSWVPASHGGVHALAGPFAVVVCEVPRELAAGRYRRRTGTRAAGHLDDLRTDAELWGAPPPVPGVGPVLRVDTAGPVDLPGLAAAVRELLGVPAR
jgi:predicted kinase